MAYERLGKSKVFVRIEGTTGLDSIKDECKQFVVEGPCGVMQNLILLIRESPQDGRSESPQSVRDCVPNSYKQR